MLSELGVYQSLCLFDRRLRVRTFGFGLATKQVPQVLQLALYRRGLRHSTGELKTLP